MTSAEFSGRAGRLVYFDWPGHGGRRSCALSVEPEYKAVDGSAGANTGHLLANEPGHRSD